MEMFGLIVLLALLLGTFILASLILKKIDFALSNESTSLIDVIWPLQHAQKIRKKLSGIKCPYCRNAFQANDNYLQCSVCSTYYHGECSKESGKCTVFGCAGDLVQK
jgi:hypothetical protein